VLPAEPTIFSAIAGSKQPGVKKSHCRKRPRNGSSSAAPSFAAGNRSARYSSTAPDSDTCTPLSSSAGSFVIGFTW
jgi:hypothetical protein